MTLDALQLRDYQQDGLGGVADKFFDEGYWRQLGVLPTGCHAAGQDILLYDGRVVKVEDIVVGDALMGPDSQPRHVLALARGREKMAEVRPVKGAAWTVNLSHVLTLVTTRQGGPFPSEQGGQIIDVRVSDYLEWTKWKKHINKLFRVGVEFKAPGLPLPIDPYFLGALLGDGSIQRKDRVSLHTADVEMIIECYREARRRGDVNISRIDTSKCPEVLLGHISQDRGSREPTSLVLALQRLGLLGTTCDDKFIPHGYKTASREHRLSLLAGLMDTDGSLSNGGYDFISKSELLANDTAFIARSLGLAAYVTPCEKTCQTGATGSYFRVSISGDCSTLPTRLKRKQAPKREQTKSVLRTGFSIVPTGNEADYFGFTLDGDGRYLLGDFTVTHNTGKTVVVSTLFHEPRIQAWLATFPRTHRKLIMIAHTEELVDQSARKMRHYNPTLKVGIERAEFAADADCDIVCASVQTLASRKGKRLAKLDKDQFRIVVMDEAHHSIASTYRTVNQYFDLLPPDTFMPKTGKMGKNDALAFQRARLAEWDKLGQPDRLLVGITATAIRTDRVGLEAVYQVIAFEETMLDMIRHDPPYLSRPRAFRVTTKTHLDGVKTSGGDFDQGQLARTVMNEERDRLIVKAWQTHANNLPTFVFCASVEHASEVARCFNAHGVSAEMICGESKDRKGLIDRFTCGTTRVLTNYGVLTEGVDVPSVECIVHARPTKSPLLYTQMTGRGSRLSPETGKTCYIVIDVVDVTRKHSLITAPTLFGLPIDFDAKGQDLSDVEKQVAEAKAAKPLLDITTIRSLHDLEIRSQEVDLLTQWREKERNEIANCATDVGDLAWLKRGADFELPFLGPVTYEKLAVRHVNGAFEVTQREFGTTTVLCSGIPTAVEAIDRAEHWMRIERPIATICQRRSSEWRAQPATVSQIRAIAGFKYDIPVARLTQGQASDMIRTQYDHQRHDG